MPVFFIHSHNVVDGVIRITHPLLTHISKSLRAKPGDSLIFNDHEGMRYHTTVDQISKQSLAAIIQQIEPPPASTPTSITVAQALLKGEKMGWVIQKATELGATAILPLITDRVILKLSETQRTKHFERWNRIALEAAQQSERWSLPSLLPIQTFQQFLKMPATNYQIIMAERQEGPSLLSLPFSKNGSETGITVIIGPEGGWSAMEIEMAQSHNCLLASFGKVILRAETASMAALATLQARFNT